MDGKSYAETVTEQWIDACYEIAEETVRDMARKMSGPMISRAAERDEGLERYFTAVWSAREKAMLTGAAMMAATLLLELKGDHHAAADTYLARAGDMLTECGRGDMQTLLALH